MVEIIANIQYIFIVKCRVSIECLPSQICYNSNYASIFFPMVFNYKLKKKCPVRNGGVAKGSHDAV